MLWYGVALRGSSLHFRRRDMSPSQPQYICNQRKHRDGKVNKLKVSEKVEEARANYKAEHIPTSQHRKKFAYRVYQRGSKPVRRRWMAAATASGGWLKVKDWPSRSPLMPRFRIHPKYKDNLVLRLCLLLWRHSQSGSFKKRFTTTMTYLLIFLPPRFILYIRRFQTFTFLMFGNSKVGSSELLPPE